MTETIALARFLACGSCPAHHTGLCVGLGEVELGALIRTCRRTELPAGATIATAGAPIREVHNIVSGIVRLSKALPDGREQIVGLLYPSDFLGTAFEEVASFTAEAATPVRLCSFERRAFEAALRAHPRLEHAVLMTVIHELHAARDWMVVLGCKTGIERVATFLALLVERAGRQGCRRAARPGDAPLSAAGGLYEIPISRADMSRYLGLSLETVSRQMSRLATLGAIRLNDPRHFTVPDPRLLSEMSGVSVGTEAQSPLA